MQPYAFSSSDSFIDFLWFFQIFHLSLAICNFPLTAGEVVWREESCDVTYFPLLGYRPHFMELFKVLSSLVPFWSRKGTAALMSSKKNELVLSWKVHKKFMDLLKKFYPELQQWILTWTKPNQVLNLSTFGFCNGNWNFKGSVREAKYLVKGHGDVRCWGIQSRSRAGPAGKRC